MDLIEQAERLIGHEVTLTWVDGVTETGTLVAVDRRQAMVSIETTRTPGNRTFATRADYEIGGTDNRYSGGDDVPPITGIEAV